MSIFDLDCKDEFRPSNVTVDGDILPAAVYESQGVKLICGTIREAARVSEFLNSAGVRPVVDDGDMCFV